MISKVFRRKAPQAGTSEPETSVDRVVKHPLSREQALERGAKGNEVKRQRKLAEAMVMQVIRGHAPTLGVILEAFPQLKKEVIWNKPELLEGLMTTFGTKASPPGDNHDGDAIQRRRKRERLEG